MTDEEKLVQAIESALGYSMPKDYAQFLIKEADDYSYDRCLFSIPGEGDDVVDYFFLPASKREDETVLFKFNTYKDRLPNGFLSIARDPGGNVLALALTAPCRGAVYFWDHEREADEQEAPSLDNMKLIAPSFSAFLSGLRAQDIGGRTKEASPSL